MKLLISMLTFSFVFATSASAEEWKRVTLQSKEGYTIMINFVVKQSSGSSYKEADPLWINVIRPGSGTLRAVVLNNVKGKYRPTSYQSPALMIDLTSKGQQNNDGTPSPLNFYTGRVGGGMTIEGPLDSYSQEIALVNEKGQWLVDPVSGQHNFKFNLWQAAQ